MEHEAGKITGVDWQKKRGIDGFFIQFNGRSSLIQVVGHREYIWISAELACILGFPVKKGPVQNTYVPEANYQEKMIGKKVWIKTNEP